MESYNFKLIQSGDHIETYEYRDKEIKKGFKRGAGLRVGQRHTKAGTRKIMKELGIHDYYDYKTNEGRHLVHPDAEPNLFDAIVDEKDKKRKAKSSLSRTRNEMRRKINANPELTTFLTLTFNRSMPKISEANVIFNRFIVRLKKTYPNFKYMAVIEFQSDLDYFKRVKPEGGSVHYHLICDLELPFKNDVEQKEFEREFAKTQWKNGFITVKPVSHVDNMGAYFCKYLSKDMFDERMFRKKKYFCSQNLKQPKEIFNDEAKLLLARVSKNSKLLFEKEMNSAWVGKIEYKNYKIGGTKDDEKDADSKKKT